MGSNLRLPVHRPDFQRSEEEVRHSFYGQRPIISDEAKRFFQHLKVAKVNPSKADWPWDRTFVMVHAHQARAKAKQCIEQGVTIGHSRFDNNIPENTLWESDRIRDIDLFIQQTEPFLDQPKSDSFFHRMERYMTSFVSPDQSLRDKSLDNSFVWIGGRKINHAHLNCWHPVWLCSSQRQARRPSERDPVWRQRYVKANDVNPVRCDTIARIDDFVYWRPHPLPRPKPGDYLQKFAVEES